MQEGAILGYSNDFFSLLSWKTSTLFSFMRMISSYSFNSIHVLPYFYSYNIDLDINFGSVDIFASHFVSACLSLFAPPCNCSCHCLSSEMVDLICVYLMCCLPRKWAQHDTACLLSQEKDYTQKPRFLMKVNIFGPPPVNLHCSSTPSLANLAEHPPVYPS